MASTIKDGTMFERDRKPRKRRRTLFSALGAVFLLISVVSAAIYLITRPVTLRVAVSKVDSNDYKVMHALATRFANDRSPIRLSVIETAGAEESVALLVGAKVEIAVARGDLNFPGDAQSLAILRKDVVILWAPGGGGRRSELRSKIKGIGDLSGHRIALVGANDENLKLLRIILMESGVAMDKVHVSKFRTDQIAEMARDPGIDAFVSVGPLNDKSIGEAIELTGKARGEPVFLAIDASDAVVQRHPAFRSSTIPKHVFSARPPRPGDEIETLGVDHMLVARRSLRDSLAATFTRQLLTARQALARDVPDAAKIEKPDTDKDAAFPAHPGAAAYVDGTERTFLETYSDYFWMAILLLSILGSAGAWMGHYLKRDERDLNTVHRDRLLDVMAKVRQAGSEGELLALQSDIDGVLRETLDCYDDGAIDEGGLMALGLVLDRLHGAIADRRSEWSGETTATAHSGFLRHRNQVQ